MLPETILQFGSGRFLRAFADLFVHQANEAGQAIGKIAVVQSTGDGRVDLLNRQRGQYHVAIRGLENGKVMDRVEECRSVSRALHAGSQWNEILRLATSPYLHTIISNTTEAGLALDPADAATESAPKSFPAKLRVLLKARWKAGLPGLTIIPCELVDGNAALLKKLVKQLMECFSDTMTFRFWVKQQCVFLHTLVDRIVTGAPAEHPLAASDPLLIAAEPFALFAIEDNPRSQFLLQHPALVRTPDVAPYFLRKVRILNAAHTALLVKAVPRGFVIVRDAVNDPELGNWLRRLLFEEIVPTLEGRVEEPARFAEQVIERFRNPFLDHKFVDIALQHESKVKVRLVPTAQEYAAKFGKPPPLLTEVLAAT